MVQPSARPPATRSSLGRATRLDIGALVDVERVLTSLAHIVESLTAQNVRRDQLLFKTRSRKAYA